MAGLRKVRAGAASIAAVGALLACATAAQAQRAPSVGAGTPCLLGEGIAGHAHIKTGLLQDARSIAGYVLDRQGRRHLVVMIINHPRASAEGQPALDAMLAWVYEGATGRGATTARPPAALPRRP